MKPLTALCILLFAYLFSFGQTKKIELFDLVKKLVQDSTGYDSFGDWAVGHPSTYAVQWQADRVEMSDDEKINFFRKGIANISINGTEATKWNIMLKGPRSGFSSFNITNPGNRNITPKQTIDSLFGKKQYSYKLLKSCGNNPEMGFYYYQLKIPKKVTAFVKIGWSCKSENCLLSLDCYDEWSKQYADLICAAK